VSAAATIASRFELAYSAVASNPETEAEGEGLARDRLEALVAAVKNFIPPASNRLPSDVLAEIPSPALSASGADGVIALVVELRKRPEPTPQTRKARVIFYKGDTTSRMGTNLDMVFELGADGKPAAYTFKVELTRMLQATGTTAPVSVELAIPGTADGAATARLTGVKAELDTLRAGVTTKGVRATTAAEQSLIDAPTEVDELVVIRL
jgi:hypothetical protein